VDLCAADVSRRNTISHLRLWGIETRLLLSSRRCGKLLGETLMLGAHMNRYTCDHRVVYLIALACALGMRTAAVANAQLVERVIDGDTILVQSVGKVRLIGVDTPELGSSRAEIETMARTAAAFVQQTAGGKEVRLDYDWQRLDKYRRTLAYAYLPDGRMLNEEIIRAGYGFAYTKYPFKYQDHFPGIEREAREARRGLWATGLANAEPIALASLDASQADSASEGVYVTRTGQAYHRDGCRSLSRSKIAMSLNEAAARYRPCSNCRPPTPGATSITRSIAPAISQASATPATSATNRVVVITGTNFSGLYHQEGCPVLASGGGLVTLSRGEAEGRHFRPHEACVLSPSAIRAAPVAAAPAYSSPSPPVRATPSRETYSGRCQATTKKGTQCSRSAKTGSRYCWQHGG
jgi:micrococcal nuclease